MTLNIALTDEEQARLREAARHHGMDKAELARRLIVDHLPPTAAGDPTLALFGAWEAEDRTDDPNEIDRRIRDWEELRRDLERSRLLLRKTSQ